jgi:hypothetical protein
MLENDTELDQEELELTEDDTDDEAEDKEEDETPKETEETEDAEPAEDAESEEDKEEGDKPNQNQKVEKRINSLTAKLKAKDEELAEARDRISELERNTEEEKQDVLNQLPAINYNGKSIYDLTNDEFIEAVETCYSRDDLTKEEKAQFVREAKEARKRYLEKIQPIFAEEMQNIKEAEVVWQTEWGEVQREFLEMYPTIQEEIGNISEFMQDEFRKRPLLVKRLKKGTVEKFKYTLDVLKRLGIDKKLDKEEYAKDTAPGMTAGKGKASPSKSKTPTFTRAQIAKMSVAEFERNEKAIDAAQKAGRIR